MQEALGSLSNGQIELPQSGDQIPEKLSWIVISLIQRQPDHIPLTVGDALAQQGGFAKAGWSGDQCQPAVKAGVQPPNQTRTRHQLRPDGGVHRV
mgnify:CR=1 FL=1